MSHQNSVIREIVALLPGTKHLSTIPTVVTSFNQGGKLNATA